MFGIINWLIDTVQFEFIYALSKVNSICFFWQLSGIWGRGGRTNPKISKITGGMIMKFLPDVKRNKDARN